MIDMWLESIAAADAADWVTVAFYLLTAYLSVRAAATASHAYRPNEGAFWRLTAGLMILLGMNELLDLQTLLTAIGRTYAKNHDWYEQRREFQYIFVLGLTVASVAVGAVALLLTWRMAVTVRAALLGIVFIGLFVLLRAASFHHLTDIMSRGHPVFNLGSLQELFGILIVAVAALIYTRGGGRPGRTHQS